MLAGKHSECWRRLGPAFAIGPRSSGQVPACTYCFHWPRASWWSVEQLCSFPFTSIPPGLLRTASRGSSFNNASTGLRGEARGSQHPPIPQVYLVPARGSGPGAAGGSRERRQPILRHFPGRWAETRACKLTTCPFVSSTVDSKGQVLSYVDQGHNQLSLIRSKTRD